MIRVISHSSRDSNNNSGNDNKTFCIEVRRVNINIAINIRHNVKRITLPLMTFKMKYITKAYIADKRIV